MTKILLLVGAAGVLLVLLLRKAAPADAWRGVPPADAYQTDKRIFAPVKVEPSAPEAIVGGGCNFVTDGKAGAACQKLGRVGQAVANWWSSGYGGPPPTPEQIKQSAMNKPVGFR